MFGDVFVQGFALLLEGTILLLLLSDLLSQLLHLGIALLNPGSQLGDLALEHLGLFAGFSLKIGKSCLRLCELAFKSLDFRSRVLQLGLLLLLDSSESLNFFLLCLCSRLFCHDNL